MPKIHSDLSPPVLLLAMPQVLDPFFHRSVILLIHHEDEGSFGFILNRPTGIKVGEILKGMEVGWEGPEESVAYFGGPVRPQLGTVLFAPSPGAEGEDSSSEVVPGLALTQHIGDLAQLAEAPPEQFRLFLGYAGWGEGQLVEEILRNDWLTAPVKSALIFASDPATVWEDALRSVGVEPAALPSWTAGGGGEETTN
ncbi:MAG: putative transcriptional regulator [Acidobacteriota bacterium]|jgi:putative transcriptional regulator|nr:putative transcriptional regulator [Acidobacteriota bacterium]